MKKMIPLFKKLLESGDTFEVQCTNAFYNIKHEGTNYKFFAGTRPNYKVFNVARKLKKEIDSCGFNCPETTIEEYFFSNQEFTYDLNEKIYCIDIKKAYQTVLKNYGIITNELYKEICELPKKDRLRATGMIARRKSKYVYSGGQMMEVVQERQTTEKYFFFCVEKTYLLMLHIANKIKNDFIFFWVDCVFFTGEKNINLIQDILSSNRFQFTLERLRILGISEAKSFHSFRFLKSCKIKEYNVPKIKDSYFLAKAKHCFFQEDFRGFQYYYNEYKKICESIP
jgi:hypothetical protein